MLKTLKQGYMRTANSIIISWCFFSSLDRCLATNKTVDHGPAGHFRHLFSPVGSEVHHQIFIAGHDDFSFHLGHVHLEGLASSRLGSRTCWMKSGPELGHPNLDGYVHGSIPTSMKHTRKADIQRTSSRFFPFFPVKE